ncbi:hypothetical protein R83H12_01766 [Fibrobacteria bacterium R8-3-H12]
MTACPSGWHLPSKEEWDVLVTYIQNDKVCTICDAHLKATSGWNDNSSRTSGNGLDSYGFSALPGGYGGYRYSGGSDFGNAGSRGHWWRVPRRTIATAPTTGAFTTTRTHTGTMSVRTSC